MSYFRLKKQTHSEMVFNDYITIKGIRSNPSQIREMLLNNTFTLRNSSAGGNNYAQFVDTNGYLSFNNPDMIISRSYLERGIVIPDIGATGNQLRYDNLVLIKNEIKKEDLVKALVDIDENFKTLEADKIEFKNQLDYLINTNSTLLNLEEYKAYKKQKITDKLLTKETTIAVVKE